MERLYTVKPKIQERILIRESTGLSHVGEQDFGFSMVLHNNKWQFEIACLTSNRKVYDYVDIPDELWELDPYESLRKLVLKEAKLDTYIRGRGSCVEWEKLEKLFKSKTHEDIIFR